MFSWIMKERMQKVHTDVGAKKLLTLLFRMIQYSWNSTSGIVDVDSVAVAGEGYHSRRFIEWVFFPFRICWGGRTAGALHSYVRSRRTVALVNDSRGIAKLFILAKGSCVKKGTVEWTTKYGCREIESKSARKHPYQYNFEIFEFLRSYVGT